MSVLLVEVWDGKVGFVCAVCCGTFWHGDLDGMDGWSGVVTVFAVGNKVACGPRVQDFGTRW